MFHIIFDYNYGNFLIDFDNFSTIGNSNKYSTTTEYVQTVSLQPNCVFTLPGKTKNNTKTADCLLQCILLNKLFQTFAEVVQYLFLSLFVR